MIKGVFKLPLRALEGFINSMFQLMNVELKSPDYSCISKRAKTVEVDYRLHYQGPARPIVIDSTELKVFGEGEWKIRKHGQDKRRIWRKVHLAVNTDTDEIVSAQGSLDSVHDSEVLPTLLTPLRRKIKQVSAGGAYDTKDCYKILINKGIEACIPPRKNAILWEDGHSRNQAVEALKADRLEDWKQETGYHERSLSETVLYRYKQLIGEKLSLGAYNGQIGEMMSGVSALNKMLGLGIPVRQAAD